MPHDAPLDRLLSEWPKVVADLEAIDDITWRIEPESQRDQVRDAIVSDIETFRDELEKRVHLTRLARERCVGSDGGTLDLRGNASARPTDAASK